MRQAIPHIELAIAADYVIQAGLRDRRLETVGEANQCTGGVAAIALALPGQSLRVDVATRRCRLYRGEHLLHQSVERIAWPLVVSHWNEGVQNSIALGAQNMDAERWQGVQMHP